MPDETPRGGTRRSPYVVIVLVVLAILLFAALVTSAITAALSLRRAEREHPRRMFCASNGWTYLNEVCVDNDGFLRFPGPAPFTRPR